MSNATSRLPDPPEAGPASMFLGLPVAAAVRRNMQSNKGRDTKPELRIRSLLHSQGLRYRVNQPLPFDPRRRADLTFGRVSLYVFIDGCFWHGCPEHFTVPKTRTDFWIAKVGANRARDLETTARLRLEGVTVMRFWEHEDPTLAATAIADTYAGLLAKF